jgi:hypothetical protein
MCSDVLRDYHYFRVGTCSTGTARKVMAMRAASRFPKRAGKEFVRNLIGALVVYAPIAAFLVLWPIAPLGGVLIFGGIFVPAVAALITVVVSAGGDPEAHDSGYDRSWGDSGYHYRDYPGSGEGGWYDGGGHPGGGDGGAGDGGGGF